MALYYEGLGTVREEGDAGLPLVTPDALTDPKGYMASPDLVAAVDVALTLGMPLLLTGEPGSGKSRLAHSLAWELGLGDPLTFVVKSDTQGRDLFYRFDTVGRFHSANSKDASREENDPRRFVSFEALGSAILYANPIENLKLLGGAALKKLKHPGKQRRSVVLIDEIDKAPRDLPNDLLTEIEAISFQIPEIAAKLDDPEYSFSPENNQRYRPIVIITSNSERGLPDAFLRRCVYYHLPFPKYRDELKGEEKVAAVTVESVVAKRLGKRYEKGGESLVTEALSLFRFIRDNRPQRKPSLAELLNWLDYLLPPLPKVKGEQRAAPAASLSELGQQTLYSSLCLTLLKNNKDQQRVDTFWQDWVDAN